MNERTNKSSPLGRRNYKLVRDRLRQIKRQILRFPLSPRLAIGYAAYKKEIRRHNWEEARERALRILNLAVESRDRRVLQDLMHGLERLECFDEVVLAHRAWRASLDADRDRPWSGEDLTGKELMIDLMERHESGLGVALRGANLVGKALRHAERSVIIVEPRLVPLFQRSFSVASVLSAAPKPLAADYVATRGDLYNAFVPTKGVPDPDFHPLVADPDLRARLRARYKARGDRLLIGIFWRSSHYGKDLPPLDAWARFMDGLDATFISLQYGDFAADLRVLGRDRVIVDPDIDQLKDMDTFAAQVSALDAVVAISGTPVHLAGALGVPTVVVRDDWFRRQWPVMNDRVPWYPSVRVVGKDGRDWQAVMDDARATLQVLTAGDPNASGKCDYRNSSPVLN